MRGEVFHFGSNRVTYGRKKKLERGFSPFTISKIIVMVLYIL